MESIDYLKDKFLSRYNKSRTVNEAISKAISASVQHNKLYADGILPKEKIKRGWESKLLLLFEKYKHEQTEFTYEQDVLNLKEQMNLEFGEFFMSEYHLKLGLEAGFRVSHSQKSISVFLKHLWCLDVIPIPPQCPVDRTILKLAGQPYFKPSWTKVNSMADHQKQINILKSRIKNNMKLAEWEISNFLG